MHGYTSALALPTQNHHAIQEGVARKTMVLTSSTMLPLGTTLPSFDLAIVPGTLRRANSFERDAAHLRNQMLQKKPLLFLVICAHCPFVKHVEAAITKLDQDYGERIQMLAVSSNSLITHPEDGLEQLAFQAKKNGWRFPYLFDSEQKFAKDLKAACTPDFFLFSPSKDGDQELRYRGQLDASRPGNDIPLTGEDLRDAMDSVLCGKKVCKDQKPSIGCNIKWHPGKEPLWFG